MQAEDLIKELAQDTEEGATNENEATGATANGISLWLLFSYIWLQACSYTIWQCYNDSCIKWTFYELDVSYGQYCVLRFTHFVFQRTILFLIRNEEKSYAEAHASASCDGINQLRLLHSSLWLLSVLVVLGGLYSSPSEFLIHILHLALHGPYYDYIRLKVFFEMNLKVLYTSY